MRKVTDHYQWNSTTVYDLLIPMHTVIRFKICMNEFKKQ